MLTLLALLACKPTADDVVVPTPTPQDDCAVAETWQQTPVPAEILAAFTDELADTSADGVAFAILIDGEIRYAGAVGQRDAENGLPMQPTTLLRNGSTLKMQTAAALIAQAARGELSLDDPLDAHLPEFSMAAQPGVAEGTTIHQLLSHQGGFYDYTPIDGPAGADALYNHAHGVFARDFYLMAEPGSFWNYSNPNFSLAGLIAQENSGRNYLTLMDEDVWTPLCMDRTTFDAAEVLADGDFATAEATDWEGGLGTRPVEPDSYDHGFARPAGFAWTSTLDMLRFADFLLAGNDTVAPGGEHLELTARQVDTRALPEGVMQYGYGVFVWDRLQDGSGWREAELWEHGGDIPGFAADLWVLPEHGIAIAVLANGSGAHFPESLAFTATTLAGLSTTSGPDLSVDPLDLDAMAGSYVDPWNVGPLEITRTGATLAVSAPRLDDLGIPYDPVMEPVYGTTVTWGVQGTLVGLDFLDGPDASPQYIRHRAFVLERATPETSSHSPSRADVERWLTEIARPSEITRAAETKNRPE